MDSGVFFLLVGSRLGTDGQSCVPEYSYTAYLLGNENIQRNLMNKEIVIEGTGSKTNNKISKSKMMPQNKKSWSPFHDS